MFVKEKEEANQLYGRMMECCDIERAIEMGEFKTIQDVLEAVKSCSNHLQVEIRASGLFKSNRIVPY